MYFYVFLCISHVFLKLTFFAHVYLMYITCIFKSCEFYVFLMYFSCILSITSPCFSHVFPMFFSCILKSYKFYIFLMFFSCILSISLPCISHVFPMYHVFFRIQKIQLCPHVMYMQISCICSLCLLLSTTCKSIMSM